MKFRSFFVFFKQKTAYEMRISDWSSDVCSSDLHGIDFARPERKRTMVEPFQATRTLKQPTVDQKPTLAIRDFHTRTGHCAPSAMKCERNRLFRVHHRPSIEYQRDGASAPLADRKTLGSGKRGSVMVNLGG